jgi:hypothetical protein
MKVDIIDPVLLVDDGRLGRIVGGNTGKTSLGAERFQRGAIAAADVRQITGDPRI